MIFNIIQIAKKRNNIFMKNILESYRIHIYYYRLNEYTKDQLIKYHYSNKKLNVDTNIEFFLKFIGIR